jgi:hypothetical protein
MQEMQPPWLKSLIEDPDGFPRPDWLKIEAAVYARAGGSKPAIAKLWHEVTSSWLRNLCGHLGRSYQVDESELFFLVTSNQDQRYASLKVSLIRGLEFVRSRLRTIAVPEEDAKHVAILFHDDELYYRYIAFFYPEQGEFPLSRVLFLRSGYRHLAISAAPISEIELSLLHELARACISHLPLPVWLEEGIALDMQEAWLPGSTMSIRSASDPSRFWSKMTIREFWSGDAFYKEDESTSQACALALGLVRALGDDRERFERFVLTASVDDAGEQGFRLVYGESLATIIGRLLGHVDLSPPAPPHD